MFRKPPECIRTDSAWSWSENPRKQSSIFRERMVGAAISTGPTKQSSQVRLLRHVVLSREKYKFSVVQGFISIGECLHTRTRQTRFCTAQQGHRAVRPGYSALESVITAFTVSKATKLVLRSYLDRLCTSFI
jgi:hypothetical protein